jgi:hypothetical protein
MRPGGSFDLDTKRAQAADLQQQAADPSLWDDPGKGRRITSELSRLNDALEQCVRSCRQTKPTVTLVEDLDTRRPRPGLRARDHRRGARAVTRRPAP